VLSDVCMYCQWYIKLVLLCLCVSVFFRSNIFLFFLSQCVYIFISMYCVMTFFFRLQLYDNIQFFVFRMISLSFYVLLSSRISCVRLISFFSYTHLFFFCFCISFDCICCSNLIHQIELMMHSN
jgi:hypothetical protein